jgi:DedD protein
MKMFNTSNISPSESLTSIDESIESRSDEFLGDAKSSLDDTKDSLFKEEPIIDEGSETDLKFEEMVRRLKEQDAKESQEAVKYATPDAVEKVKEINIVDKIKDIAETPVKKIEEKVVEIAKPVSKPKVVEIAPIKEQVISTREEISPDPSPISSMSGYFIQVGATSKSFPDKRFLNKVKNAGFDYIVHKVVVKGQNIKKVLVGPYGTREEARADLSSVQSKINPSSYIYRVK